MVVNKEKKEQQQLPIIENVRSFDNACRIEINLPSGSFSLIGRTGEELVWLMQYFCQFSIIVDIMNGDAQGANTPKVDAKEK